MPTNQKATDQQIADTYAAEGSVWKAADVLGMCGQSVHERLVKLGLQTPMNVFSDAEKAILKEQYQDAANAGRLDDLAKAMSRTKPFICRQARALGLTDQGRLRKYLVGVANEAMMAWHAVHEHPRGMLGKKHTAAVCEAIAKAGRERWEAMTEDERDALIIKRLKAKAAKNGGKIARDEVRLHTTWKSDWREIGGQRVFYRSLWEANYARYLEFLRAEGKIASWQHEPKTFWFEEIKRGVRSYLPDFRVVGTDGGVTFHEVKGWMDERSKTTLSRMALYYPEVAMIVIGKDEYRKMKNLYRWVIDGWEA